MTTEDRITAYVEQRLEVLVSKDAPLYARQATYKDLLAYSSLLFHSGLHALNEKVTNSLNTFDWSGK